MWIITEEQIDKIKQSTQNNFIIRTCKRISSDREFVQYTKYEIEDIVKEQKTRIHEYNLNDREKFIFIKHTFTYPNLRNKLSHDLESILSDINISETQRVELLNNYCEINF